MRSSPLAIVLLILFITVSVMVFLSPAKAIKFSSFEEQVDYCAWKYQHYCDEWEHENEFNPNNPPANGFRNYAQEYYQNGLDLKDGLDICLSYEDYEE